MSDFVCANGHDCGNGDKFCVQCGGAVSVVTAPHTVIARKPNTGKLVIAGIAVAAVAAGSFFVGSAFSQAGAAEEPTGGTQIIEPADTYNHSAEDEISDLDESEETGLSDFVAGPDDEIVEAEPEPVEVPAVQLTLADVESLLVGTWATGNEYQFGGAITLDPGGLAQTEWGTLIWELFPTTEYSAQELADQLSLTIDDSFADEVNGTLANAVGRLMISDMEIWDDWFEIYVVDENELVVTLISWDHWAYDWDPNHQIIQTTWTRVGN